MKDNILIAEAFMGFKKIKNPKNNKSHQNAEKMPIVVPDYFSSFDASKSLLKQIDHLGFAFLYSTKQNGTSGHFGTISYFKGFESSISTVQAKGSSFCDVLALCVLALIKKLEEQDEIHQLFKDLKIESPKNMNFPIKGGLILPCCDCRNPGIRPSFASCKCHCHNRY
jgi:hypothetical protein